MARVTACREVILLPLDISEMTAPVADSSEQQTGNPPGAVMITAGNPGGGDFHAAHVVWRVLGSQAGGRRRSHTTSAVPSSSHRPHARRRLAHPASLAGRRRVRRAVFRPPPQDVQGKDELAPHCLSFLVCASFNASSSFGRACSAFSAAATNALANLDLSDGQLVLPRCLRHRRLTPDDAQHQSPRRSSAAVNGSGAANG